MLNCNEYNGHQNMYNRICVETSFIIDKCPLAIKMHKRWHILMLQYKKVIGINNQQIRILDNGWLTQKNVKWRKPDIEEYIWWLHLYKILTYMKLLYIVKVKVIVTLETVVRKDRKETQGVGDVLSLGCLCSYVQFVKIPQAVHLRYVHFSV